MEISFHRQVQADLREALDHYEAISEPLVDDFFAEFKIGLQRVQQTPAMFHFDSCGLRRFNLERFPYHFLYDLRTGDIRVGVLRHHQRRPSFGTKRFR